MLQQVRSIVSVFCFLFVAMQVSSQERVNIDVVKDLISNQEQKGYFPLVTDNFQTTIVYDNNDHKGVLRAIGDLQRDIHSVTNLGVRMLTSSEATIPSYPVIVGTLGNSQLIDLLVSQNKLDSQDIKDKWESFVITTIENPFPNVKKALVIAGSDKRGTIYGIYELSKQLGVSPWYWWADTPIEKRPAAYLKEGYFYSGEPKVKYRGIFINDENPSMQKWARSKFGGMNSKMYTHMFELLLRLRANYLWPGMWGSMLDYEPNIPILLDKNGNYEGNSFNEDDPENPRLADEYGIVMGTSHHEPMQRSQQEWMRNKSKYGNGQWNYQTNKKGIQKFFREGIQNTKNYESLITMGMRGDDDKPMEDAGSAEANFRVLENIMKDQRSIIESVTGKPAYKTPQVWTLYSEVLEYYDQGMNVPDDVIIMLCNDNWGNVRRLPEIDSKRHTAGYGMYYHVAYYGAPRASKWLNYSQIPKIWEQMQLTYSYGVDKIWILNVGDLKPCEYPMDFFLNMAWNPESFNQNNLDDYALQFCKQQFGTLYAKEAAYILNQYCKYSSRITAELLDDKTYNLESGEFEKVRNEFMALEAQTLNQYLSLPDTYRDVYKQLILFPVQAMSNLYDMYYSLAMNKKFGKEKDQKANFWADRVEACFKRDANLSFDYNHNIADGKWNHMMDQVHIGYERWHPKKENTMPKVIRVSNDEIKTGGYLFKQKNGVVVMESEHYYEAKNSTNSIWTIIPDMGRTSSGIALMPYNQRVENASLTYKMQLETKQDSVKVHIILNSTMPFKRGGHHIAINFEGATQQVINLNSDLVWGNHYSKMYPTGAQRIIEKQVTLALPENAKGTYDLVFQPLDPGVALYKIIVDCGGYEYSHLKMSESPYQRR